jgi:hypothetical protein
MKGNSKTSKLEKRLDQNTDQVFSFLGEENIVLSEISSEFVLAYPDWFSNKAINAVFQKRICDEYQKTTPLTKAGKFSKVHFFEEVENKDYYPIDPLVTCSLSNILAQEVITGNNNLITILSADLFISKTYTNLITDQIIHDLMRILDYSTVDGTRFLVSRPHQGGNIVNLQVQVERRGFGVVKEVSLDICVVFEARRTVNHLRGSRYDRCTLIQLGEVDSWELNYLTPNLAYFGADLISIKLPGGTRNIYPSILCS